MRFIFSILGLLAFVNAVSAQSLGAIGEDNPWRAVGPNNLLNTNGLSKLDKVYVHPSDTDFILVGAEFGGCWKSHDNGVTWSNTTDDIPNLGVKDIYFDDDSDQLYLITTDNRVMTSVDSGRNWSPFNLNIILPDANALEINKLVVFEGNIFIGTSLGLIVGNKNNFQGILNQDIGIQNIVDIKIKPNTSAIIYCTTAGNNPKFYRSVDRGVHFNQVVLNTNPESNRITIGVTNRVLKRIYLLEEKVDAQGSELTGLHFSNNSGASFQSITYSNLPKFNTESEHWNIAVSNQDANTVYLSGTSIYKSNDQGRNWIAASNDGFTFVSVGHNDMYVSSSNQLYTVTNGGLYTSKNEAIDWEFIAEGISTGIYNELDTRTVGGVGYILAASENNGLHQWNGKDWTFLFGGDIKRCAYDGQDPETFYFLTEQAQFFKSTNQGINTLGVFGANVAGENYSEHLPFKLNKKDNALWMGFQKLWNSNDQGDIWNAYDTPLSNEVIQFLSISDANPDLIYIVKSNRIYRSEDRANNWKEILRLNDPIELIEANDDNENELCIVAGNRLYFSENKGENFVDIQYNVEPSQINDIAFQNEPDAGIYMATDTAVYFKLNNETIWSTYNNSLPLVGIKDLQLDSELGVILAATEGRSIWENVLFTEDCSNEIEFVLPLEDQVLDNACDYFGDDQLIWEFQWLSCEPAERYHFRIYDPEGTLFVSEDNLLTTKYIYLSDNGLENNQLTHWSYQIRSLRNGSWEPWTPLRYFDVEAFNNDCEGTSCTTATSIRIPGLYVDNVPSGFGGVNDGNASASSWYTFTAQHGGSASIYSCNSGVDTRLWIYEGDCESLQLIDSSDDDCESSPGQDFASGVFNLFVEEGKRYTIEWDGYWSTEAFDWYIEVEYDLACDLQYESSTNYPGSSSVNSGNIWIDVDGNGSALNIESTNSNGCNTRSFVIQGGSDFGVVINDFNTDVSTIIEYKFRLKIEDEQSAVIIPLVNNLTGEQIFQLEYSSSRIINLNGSQIGNYTPGEWYELVIQVDLFGIYRIYQDLVLIGFGQVLEPSFDGVMFSGEKGSFHFDCICVSSITNECPNNILIDRPLKIPTDSRLFAKESVLIEFALDQDNLSFSAGNCIELLPGFSIDKDQNLSMLIDVCPE